MNRGECEDFVRRAVRLPRARALLEHLAGKLDIEKPDFAQLRGEGEGEDSRPVFVTPSVAGPHVDEEAAALAILPIICRECSSEGVEGTCRAFFSDPPAITLCTNVLKDEEDLSSALVHELVHAVDHCTRGMNLRDCRKLACSEVRAAREADCASSAAPSFAAKFLPSYDEWVLKRCSRSKALAATSALFPKDAPRCIDEVFARCFDDTFPMHEKVEQGRPTDPQSQETDSS